MTFPWIPKIGPKIKKEIQKFGSRVVFQTGLKNILCKNKDKLMPNSYPEVYELKCSCGSVYNGETKTKIISRLIECQQESVKGNWSSSGANEHTKESHGRFDWFLSPQLKRLLCNALMEPYVPLMYPNLNNKFKTKLQTFQNKCVRFGLQLDNRAHVGITKFKKINLLPVDYRFRRCLIANAFKFFDDRCPSYMKDVFDRSCINQASTRNSSMKVSQPLRRTNHD